MNFSDPLTTAPELADWPSAPEERSFLLDKSLWAHIGTRQIVVEFKASYEGGKHTNRYARTCPTDSTGPQGQVSSDGLALTWTNNKGTRVYDIVNVEHLSRVPPKKKAVECVPLDGGHRSMLATVLKITKKTSTAFLESVSVSTQQPQTTEKWQEDLDNLCVVEQVK